MNMNTQKADASRASYPISRTSTAAYRDEQRLENERRSRLIGCLKFTLPPEPVSAEEMAEHDARIDPPAAPEPFDVAKHGGIVMVQTDDPAPTWLTARPVIFALGTAAGALFVLLLRGWA